MDTALLVKDVSKKFPGVQALNSVSLEVLPGEVHALVGENGAGKSTLINILSGVIKPDSGEIFLIGNKVEIENPLQARRMGISTVYQELSVVPQLTVAENIFLGREPRGRLRLLDKESLFEQSSQVLEAIGYQIDPRRRVGTLSIAEQQMVEIARNVSADSRILIMDEPTSSLSRAEVQKLFGIIAGLKEKGISIIYVSHEMEEIFEMADRITVFRNGENVATVSKTGTTPKELVKMMVGREVEYMASKKTLKEKALPELLTAKALSNHRLNNINLELGKGEILGVVGLVGSGKTELARALFGLDRIEGGELFVQGRHVKFGSPLNAIRNGLGYVTESRRDDGLVLMLGVQENICLVIVRQLARWLGLVSRAPEKSVAQKFVQGLDIKTAGLSQKVEFLSGGNQQKVVLSKWLARRPTILILDEPTRGIDVGTRQEFYTILEGIASEGVGIIVLTSDVLEALRVSDRILAMRKGEIVAELNPAEISYRSILEIMTGGSRDDK